MKLKAHILFWIDVALAGSLVLLAATGIIMHWVLPPGTGGRHGGGGGGGGGAGRTLFDLSRHDWGDLHFWIATFMVLFVLFHLALHWGWIRASLLKSLGLKRRNDPHPPPATPAAAAHERS